MFMMHYICLVLFCQATIGTPLANRSPAVSSQRSPANEALVSTVGSLQSPLKSDDHKHPSIPLIKYSDELYLIDVDLGTPAQSFRVVADIGSSDFWVLGKSAGLVFCHDHGCFNSTESSTFRPNGSDFTWRDPNPFTIFPFTGHVSVDKLSVAGVDAPNQSFGEIEMGDRLDFAFYFEFNPNDGSFGLGPAKYSLKNGVLSPIHNILSQHSVPIFSIYLGSDSESSDAEIIFGGFNSKHFTGQLQEIPALKGYDHWAVGLDKIFAGEESIGLGKHTIVEFGSTDATIGLPANLFAYFESRIVPEDPEEACNARSTMPDLIYELAGRNYTLTPQEYVLEVFEGYCISQFYPTDSEMNGPEKFSLGLSFLRKYYSVYNTEKHTVSLAVAK